MLSHEEIMQKVYSADDYNYSGVTKDTPKVKECPLCKKLFVGEGRNGSRQRYCKRTHYLDCLVCGRPIAMKVPSEKYGAVRYTCSKECESKLKIQKAQDTLEAKYGVRNPSQVKEFHDKAVEKIKAKIPETNKKARATLESKYGGIGTASPVLRQKIEATMMERYGVTNPDESPELRKKMSEVQKSKEVRQKHIDTCREKYGTNYPAQSEIVQIAMMETLMANHGVPYSGMIPESREKAMQTCEERYGVKCTLQLPESQEKARQAMLENRTGRSSKVNQEFMEFLESNGVKVKEEEYIDGKWFDMRVLGTNIVVEIDPSYTHSDLPNHWESVGKDPRYHIERSRLAQDNGYRCIHVFDWDEREKVLNLVLPKEKIYARRCEVKSVDPKDVTEFIQRNHIQGDARGAKYAYALFYQGELLSVMTFGKPRYNKNYEWELLRLCTDSKHQVVGGASKMFQKFLKEVNPESIISYCDRAKFNGEVYEKIGMSLHHTSSPAKVWSRGVEYVTDNLLRQRGFDQLFHTNYGKGTSNEALMIRSGWRSVYDCGQMVFEWKR